MEYKKALDEQTTEKYATGVIKTGTILPIEDRPNVWFVDLQTETEQQHRRTVQVISKCDNGRLLSRLKPDSELDVDDQAFKLRPGKIHLEKAH